MFTFANYAYYLAQGGNLPMAEYDAAVDGAYAEILSQTSGAALNAPPVMLEPIKRCECALVDVIAGYQRTAEILPRGVLSVNNDGFSVSTGSASVNGRSITQTEAEERATVCARHLQWPMNLMCRWL